MGLKKSYTKVQRDTVDVAQTPPVAASGFYVTYLEKGDTGNHVFRVNFNDGGSNSVMDLTDFDGDYTSLSNVPSTFTPSAHTHTVSEISDLAAGPGIDFVNGNTISIETDLRDGISKVGYTGTHAHFDNSNTNIDLYAGGNLVGRIDEDGNLKVTGDITGFATL